MCLQCGFALCSACQLATHTKGRFRQHEVLPVEKAWQRGPRKCSAHPDQTLDLFCQTCQVSGCITCCFKGSHRGHVVVPLPEIATETKEAMENHLVLLTSAARDAASVEQGAKLLLPMYKDRLNDVRGQVTSAFAALREALQQRETFLLEQLDASSQRVQSTIEKHANVALTIATAFRTSHDGLQKLLDTLNPVSLMDSAARIRCSYDAVSSFLNQQIRAVEGFTTKLGTQLRDPEARERLASFLLFPNSHLATPAENETSLCEYKELLSHLGHLEFIDDVESSWNTSQTLAEDTWVDHVGLSLDSVNAVVGVNSTKDTATKHPTTQATSVKVCGKGAHNLGLDIGFSSIEVSRGEGIQLSAIDPRKVHILGQEGALQGKAMTSEEERSIFHFARNHDAQKDSRDFMVEQLKEVVNTQNSSFYPRKRPYPLSKTAHDNINKSSQISQLVPQGPDLSCLDDERPHQAFARARLESFFERNN
ncbi:unnamed protein product [Phytomonas sp. EM1]|nr:unnamed protein product [Phytomonas sp. EM1]|eukprot:CCW60023.1 unnamed protein product [Phytomonas sp. isolate EM1]